MLSSQIPAFQKNLSAWYQKNARDLPWRHTKDPYAVWASEIMLQQTQVKTVIPYYKKWMTKFPSVKALARAPLNEVLRYWAGLGYYRRARMLHQGAQALAKEFNGSVPKSATELQKIKGIGRYTAGAIASIAFEERVPVLDGNVIRILSRIYALKEDVGLPKTIQKLWILAERILPQKSIGDFNQALMELGATVCFPKNPACSICPAVSFCAGSKQNPEDFPVKMKKEPLETLETAALILRNRDKILIRKQTVGERWGGLWMFPHWKAKKIMLQETGFAEKDLSNKMTVKHGFTKYRITLRVYEMIKTLDTRLKTQDSRFKNQSLGSRVSGLESYSRWVKLKDLKTLPFPSPHQKIVSELLKNEK